MDDEEDRVDGQQLRPLDEDGSDDRLSDETQVRIAEAVAEAQAKRPAH